MLPGNKMDSMLEREVITSQHMPDQLLAVIEMVTMDFLTSKEKIFLHSYEGRGHSQSLVSEVAGNVTFVCP